MINERLNNKSDDQKQMTPLKSKRIRIKFDGDLIDMSNGIIVCRVKISDKIHLTTPDQLIRQVKEGRIPIQSMKVSRKGLSVEYYVGESRQKKPKPTSINVKPNFF